MQWVGLAVFIAPATPAGRPGADGLHSVHAYDWVSSTRVQPVHA